MTKVTFACECPQAHVELVIERASQQIVTLLFERSGEQSTTLDAGTFDVGYRAQGTPRTAFSFTAEGGKMMPVDRLLPDDGIASGLETIEVRA